MGKTAPSLTGLRATAGHSVLSLGGIFKAEVAMMPMFDTPEQARPTRNNICKEHRIQLKQSWWCPEGKHYPGEGGTIKAVDVSPVGFVDAEDGWDKLVAPTDPTMTMQAWVKDIDTIFFSGTSYFLFPNEAKEVGAFLIIMGLLRQEGGYLLTTTKGEYGTSRVLAISWHAPTACVIGQLCHHSQYLRMAAAERIASVIIEEPDPKHLKLAKEVFGELPETFELKEVRDTLGDAQWKYVNEHAQVVAKEQGKPSPIVETEDLMASLKATQTSLKPRKIRPSKQKGKVKA